MNVEGQITTSSTGSTSNQTVDNYSLQLDHASLLQLFSESSEQLLPGCILDEGDVETKGLHFDGVESLASLEKRLNEAPIRKKQGDSVESV